MPQIIQSYIREVGPLQYWLEVLIDKAIHILVVVQFEIHRGGNRFWPVGGNCGHGKT